MRSTSYSRFSRVLLALIVISPAAVAGCTADTASEAPDVAPDEAIGSTSQAVVRSKDVTIGTAGMALVRSIVGLSKTTFSIHDGNAVLMPSPEMRALMGTTASPDPAVRFSIPPQTIETAWYLPNLVVSMQHLEMIEPPSIEVNDTHLDVITAVKGTINVDAVGVWPNAKYVVNRADVTARLAVGAGGALVVADVKVAVDGHVENCGAFGWCSALVNAFDVDVAGPAGGAAKAALATELAKPGTQNGWFKFLDNFANIVSDGGPSWVADRATVNINGGELRYVARRRTPPDPPVCSYTVGCNDAVTMHCTGSWITGAEVTTSSGVIYANAGWDFARGAMKLTWGGSAIVPEPTQTARVCSNDEDGTTCTNVTVNLPHVGCLRPIPTIIRPPIGIIRPF